MVRELAEELTSRIEAALATFLGDLECFLATHDSRPAV